MKRNKFIRNRFFAILLLLSFVQLSFMPKRAEVSSISNRFFYVVLMNPKFSGKKINKLEAKDWLASFNKKKKLKNGQELLFVQYNDSNISYMLTLPRQQETNFIAKSIFDYTNFKKCFPTSNRIPEVYKSTIENLSSPQILEFLEIAPNLECENFAGKAYLDRSNSVMECGEMPRKYKELYKKAEEKAASLAKGMNDVNDYRRLFKESSFEEKMISNVAPKLTGYQLKKLKELYPNANSINQAIIKKISTSKDFYSSITAIKTFPEFIDQGDETLAKFSKSVKQKEIYLEHYPYGKFSNQFTSDLNKIRLQKQQQQDRINQRLKQLDQELKQLQIEKAKYGISIYELDNVYELINILNETTNYIPKEDNSKRAATISFFEGLYKVKLESFINSKKLEICANGENQFTLRRFEKFLKDSLDLYKNKIVKNINSELRKYYKGKYSIDNLSVDFKIGNYYNFDGQYFPISIVIKSKTNKSFFPINENIKWNDRLWITGENIRNYRYEVFNPKIDLSLNEEFNGRLFIKTLDAEILLNELPISMNFSPTDRLFPVELLTVGIQLGSVSSSQYNYIFWVDSELRIKDKTSTIFPLITNYIKSTLREKNEKIIIENILIEND
jgi:hypothetical protein